MWSLLELGNKILLAYSPQTQFPFLPGRARVWGREGGGRFTVRKKGGLQHCKASPWQEAGLKQQQFIKTPTRSHKAACTVSLSPYCGCFSTPPHQTCHRRGASLLLESTWPTMSAKC